MITLTLYTANVRGRIGTSFYFTCGVCANSRDFLVRLRSEAIRDARAMGWKLRTDLGWVCSGCLHQESCPECEPGNLCQRGWEMSKTWFR